MNDYKDSTLDICNMYALRLHRFATYDASVGVNIKVDFMDSESIFNAKRIATLMASIIISYQEP